MFKWEKKIHEEMMRTGPGNRKWLIHMDDVDKMIPRFYNIPPTRGRERRDPSRGWGGWGVS